MEQEIITRQATRADLDGIMRIETSCFGPDSFSKKQFVPMFTFAFLYNIVSTTNFQTGSARYSPSRKDARLAARA